VLGSRARGAVRNGEPPHDQANLERHETAHSCGGGELRHERSETTYCQSAQGKLDLILDRIEDKTGATFNELVDAKGWQKHSLHGALSRLRTRGFAIRVEAKDGRKVYRLSLVEA
jgi:hypothetical protein